jgi:hypothetical protein
MSTQTTKFFLAEDLENAAATGSLEESDLSALRAVADWIETFVAKPHENLGRPGTVCPFVPRGLEAKTLWLVPEHAADAGVPDLVQIAEGCKRQFLSTEPTDGDALDYKAVVVVFTDLPTDRAKEVLDAVLAELSVASYVEDGLVMGEFFEGNEGTAIYNPSFHPFTSPFPFLLIRHAVVGDWKFFLDDDAWLGRWADRFGTSAVKALAEELRRLPWRTPHD